MNVIRRLASLKLALAGMLALLGGVLVAYLDRDASVLWVVVPLLALSANLSAAILVNRSFRRHGGLLVFHVGLLGVVLLVAWGRMTNLDARVEITEGQAFDASMIQVLDRGPWHPMKRLAGVDFRQGPIKVAYDAHLVRRETRSQVAFSADRRDDVIAFGDSKPLTVNGYRFYTTSNKGFAAVVTWFGKDGTHRTGTLHFPSYPLKDWSQVVEWRTPAGTELEFSLKFRDPVPESRGWTLHNRRPVQSFTVRLPASAPIALVPGAEATLPEGRLRLEDVRMWMGYEIFYDPTLPWLFATAFVAVLGIAWYFWGKLAPRPAARHAARPVEDNGGVIRV